MDWSTIILLIGAVGGLATGAAGLLTARRAARKTEVEALTLSVESLVLENERLRTRLAEFESKLKESQACEQELRARVKVLEDENGKLRRRMEKRGLGREFV